MTGHTKHSKHPESETHHHRMHPEPTPDVAPDVAGEPESPPLLESEPMPEPQPEPAPQPELTTPRPSTIVVTISDNFDRSTKIAIAFHNDEHAHIITEQLRAAISKIQQDNK